MKTNWNFVTLLELTAIIPFIEGKYVDVIRTVLTVWGLLCMSVIYYKTGGR